MICYNSLFAKPPYEHLPEKSGDEVVSRPVSMADRIQVPWLSAERGRSAASFLV